MLQKVPFVFYTLTISNFKTCYIKCTDFTNLYFQEVKTDVFRALHFATRLSTKAISRTKVLPIKMKVIQVAVGQSQQQTCVDG